MRAASSSPLTAKSLPNPRPPRGAADRAPAERGLAGRERLIAQQRGDRDGGVLRRRNHTAAAGPTGAALESAPGTGDSKRYHDSRTSLVSSLQAQAAAAGSQRGRWTCCSTTPSRLARDNPHLFDFAWREFVDDLGGGAPPGHRSRLRHGDRADASGRQAPAPRAGAGDAGGRRGPRAARPRDRGIGVLRRPAPLRDRRPGLGRHHAAGARRPAAGPRADLEGQRRRPPRGPAAARQPLRPRRRGPARGDRARRGGRARRPARPAPQPPAGGWRSAAMVARYASAVAVEDGAVARLFGGE